MWVFIKEYTNILIHWCNALVLSRIVVRIPCLNLPWRMKSCTPRTPTPLIRSFTLLKKKSQPWYFSVVVVFINFSVLGGRPYPWASKWDSRIRHLIPTPHQDDSGDQKEGILRSLLETHEHLVGDTSRVHPKEDL